MTQKIRLSESQKKVIRAMREGDKIRWEGDFNSGNYWLSPKHLKTVYAKTVSKLEEQGLILREGISAFSANYWLTDLGKSISLD